MNLVEYEMLVEKAEQVKTLKEKIDALEEKIGGAKDMFMEKGYINICALNIGCINNEEMCRLIVRALEADLKDLKEQFRGL